MAKKIEMLIKMAARQFRLNLLLIYDMYYESYKKPGEIALDHFLKIILISSIFPTEMCNATVAAIR